MIDITRPLRSGHPTWPGDTPFRLESTATLGEGSSVNLMMLATSTHVGTHLDAPFHYRADGGRLQAVPLELLLGEALVLPVAGDGPVGAAALPAAGEPLPERLLVATGEPDAWERFPEAFRPLSAELVHALADRGVRLVGTDAPSVDAFTSKELPVHRACAERGVFIVEGLALATVAAGRYRLLCLPLHLPEADASPVRALLEPL